MLLANIFSGPDMMIVFVVVLLLFGGKKLPELMRGVGRGLGELQKGIDESKRTLQASMSDLENDHKVHEIVPRPAEGTQAYTAPGSHVDEAS